MRASLRWQAPVSSDDDELIPSPLNTTLINKPHASTPNISPLPQPTPRRKLTRNKFIAPNSPIQQQKPETTKPMTNQPSQNASPIIFHQSPFIATKPTSPTFSQQNPSTVQLESPTITFSTSPTPTPTSLCSPTLPQPLPQQLTPSLQSTQQQAQLILHQISSQVHSTDVQFSPFNQHKRSTAAFITPQTYIGPSFQPIAPPSALSCNNKQEKQLMEQLTTLFNPQVSSSTTSNIKTSIQSIQNTPLSLHDDVQLHINQLLFESHLNSLYPITPLSNQSTQYGQTYNTNLYTNFILDTDPLAPSPSSYDRKDTIGQSILCHLFSPSQLSQIHQPMVTHNKFALSHRISHHHSAHTSSTMQNQSDYSYYNLPNIAFQYILALKRSVLNNDNWFTHSSNYFHQYLRKQFNDFSSNSRGTKTSQKNTISNIQQYITFFYHPTEQLQGYTIFLQLLQQYYQYFMTFRVQNRIGTSPTGQNIATTAPLKTSPFSTIDITHYTGNNYTTGNTSNSGTMFGYKQDLGTTGIVENSILYPLHTIVQQTFQPLQSISEIVQIPIHIIQQQKMYGTSIGHSIFEQVFQHLVLLIILGKYDDIIIICTHEVFKNTQHQTVLIFLLDLIILLYNKRRDDLFFTSPSSTIALQRYNQLNKGSNIASGIDTNVNNGYNDANDQDNDDDGYGLPSQSQDRFAYLIHLWKSQQWSNNLNYKLSPTLLILFKLIVGIFDSTLCGDIISTLYLNTTLGHTLYQSYYISEEYITSTRPSPTPISQTNNSTSSQNNTSPTFYQLVESSMKYRFVANWSWLISTLIAMYHINIPSELNIKDDFLTEVDGIEINLHSKQRSIFNLSSNTTSPSTTSTSLNSSYSHLSSSSTPSSSSMPSSKHSPQPSSTNLLGMYFNEHVQDDRKPIFLSDFLSVVESINTDCLSTSTVSLIDTNDNHNTEEIWSQNINITLLRFFGTIPHPIIYDTLFGTVSNRNFDEFNKYKEYYASKLWNFFTIFTEDTQSLFPSTHQSQTTLLLTSLPSSITPSMISSRKINTNVILNLKWFTATSLLSLLYNHSNFNILYYPLMESPVFTLQSLIYQFKDILLDFKQWQWACYILQHTIYYKENQVSSQLITQSPSSPSSLSSISSFINAVESYQQGVETRTNNGSKMVNQHIYDIWSILLANIAPVPHDNFILLEESNIHSNPEDKNEDSLISNYSIGFPIPPCPTGMDTDTFNVLLQYVTILRNLGVTAASMTQYYSELKHLEAFESTGISASENQPTSKPTYITTDYLDNLEDDQNTSQNSVKKSKKRPSLRFSLGVDDNNQDSDNSEDESINVNTNIQGDNGVKKTKFYSAKEESDEEVVLGLEDLSSSQSTKMPQNVQRDDLLTETTNKLNVFAQTFINGIQIGLDEIEELTHFLSVLFILEQEHIKCQNKISTSTSNMGHNGDEIQTPFISLFVDLPDDSETSLTPSSRIDTTNTLKDGSITPNTAIKHHLINMFKPSKEQQLINNLYTPQSIDNLRRILIQFLLYYENWEKSRPFVPTNTHFGQNDPIDLLNKQRQSIKQVQGMVDDVDSIDTTDEILFYNSNDLSNQFVDSTDEFTAMLERNNSFTDKWLIKFVHLPDIVVTLARFLVATQSISPNSTQSKNTQFQNGISDNKHNIFQFLLMLRLEQQWTQHRYTYSSIPSLYTHYYSQYKLPYLKQYMNSIYTSHYFNSQQYQLVQPSHPKCIVHPAKTVEFQHHSSFFAHLPTQFNIPLTGAITTPTMLSLLEDVTMFRPAVETTSSFTTSSANSTSKLWKQILGEKEIQETSTISLPFLSFFTNKYPLHTTFISTFSTYICPMIFNLSQQYQQQCDELFEKTQTIQTGENLIEDVTYPLEFHPQYFQHQFVHLYCLYFLPQINHWANVSQIVDQELFLSAMHEMINPLYETHILDPNLVSKSTLSISQAMKTVSKRLIDLATRDSIEMLFTFSCYYVLGLLYRYISLTEVIETFIAEHIDEYGQFITQPLETNDDQIEPVHPVGIVCDSLDIVLGDMYFLLSVGDSKYTSLLIPYTTRLIDTKLSLFKILILSNGDDI